VVSIWISFVNHWRTELGHLDEDSGSGMDHHEDTVVQNTGYGDLNFMKID
jgi:hypothetical protein